MTGHSEVLVSVVCGFPKRDLQRPVWSQVVVQTCVISYNQSSNIIIIRPFTTQVFAELKSCKCVVLPNLY